MSAKSSIHENKILLTKPFQASQSWHQLSVYENKILVQSIFDYQWSPGTRSLIFFDCQKHAFESKLLHILQANRNQQPIPKLRIHELLT